MKRIYCIAAVLSAIVGCAQIENDLLPDNGLSEEGAVRLKAVLEGADDATTKTVLGAPEDNIYPVLWSAEDEIKILTSGHRVADGTGTKMTLSEGAGSSEGVFEGKVPVLPEGCKLYYAVYPYSLEASIGMPEGQSWEDVVAQPEGEWEGITLANTVVIPLPSVQKYAPHSFGKDYSPALAVTDDVTSDDAELRFKNVCGLLQLNFTGNVTVGKIVIEDNARNPLWGTVIMQYRRREEPFWDQIILDLRHAEGLTDDKAKKHVLTLDCGEGVLLTDEPTDFYFAIPLLKYHEVTGSVEEHVAPLSSGFTVKVYGVDGEELYTKHTDVNNSIVRSKIRQMPVVDIRSTTLTNLSANGTANSYIVPLNTEASFYALTRGVGSYPVGNIASVDVFWETNMSRNETHDVRDGFNYSDVGVNHGDIIKSVRYDSSTGYVTLKTGNIEGNALISVKDASGTILWSWHIWVTNYNPESQYGQDYYESAIFMNRNLGALGTISEDSRDLSDYGLRYVWGRKDPLEGADNYYGTMYRYAPADPFDDKEADSQMGYEDEYIIKHPTTYILGRPDVKEEGTYRWDKKKTDNDPCPPGWQVADFEVFHQMVGGYVSQDLTLVTSTPDDRPAEDDLDLWGAFQKERSNYWANTLFNSVAAHEGQHNEATYPVGRHWTNKEYYTYGYSGTYYYSGLGQSTNNDLFTLRCQKSSTVSSEKPTVDLSRNGTANSYMVKPAGSYKFKANLKGNSGEAVGVISAVEVIYMTENKNTVRHDADSKVIRDVYYDNGYIYFSTSLDNIYGNAVIAIKDFLGNRVWSWHIWSVDYDPAEDYDLVDWGDSKRKVMKMNLGALSNDIRKSESLGMMYQWGRKDPFISTNDYYGQTQCNIDGLTIEADEFSEETGDIWYTLHNPNRAIKGNENGNWLAEPNNGLWAEQKTIFDPCPPGWKVPSRPTWDGEHTSVGVFETGGLTMGGVWYPATGFRNTSFNFTAVGHQGHYWYSTAKDDNSAYAFYFDNQNIDLANHADPKAQCNPVRCVMEE